MDANSLPESQLLYEKVIEVITNLIDTGTLQPGEKLPSIRKLSTQLGVSMATVVYAYELLAIDGFIESKPKSGFYVALHPLRTLSQPETSQPTTAPVEVHVHEILITVAEAAGDQRMIHLGAATPSTDFFPIADLKRTTASICRNDDGPAFFYQFPPGNIELCHQISKYALKMGCHFSYQDIVITSGGMEAIQICLRAVASPGDTIAIESPTFYPVVQTLENLGMYALEIPTSPQYGMDLDALEKALKQHNIKACFVIPNFNNPLGFLMPEENKRRMVQLMTHHGVPIIEDNIYGDMYFGPKRPKPLKAYDQEGLVLHCGSFSKSLCPGFRVGYAVPGQYIKPVERLKYMTSIATPTIPQMVVSEFLRTGRYERHTEKVRKLFKHQVALFTEAIAESFPADIRITRPEGGFILWIELPKSVNSIELYQQAIRHQISIAPGPMFSVNNNYQNFIRLSCGYPWSPEIEQALVTLGQLIRKM